MVCGIAVLFFQCGLAGSGVHFSVLSGADEDVGRAILANLAWGTAREALGHADEFARMYPSELSLARADAARAEVRRTREVHNVALAAIGMGRFLARRVGPPCGGTTHSTGSPISGAGDGSLPRGVQFGCRAFATQTQTSQLTLRGHVEMPVIARSAAISRRQPAPSSCGMTSGRRRTGPEPHYRSRCPRGRAPDHCCRRQANAPNRGRAWLRRDDWPSLGAPPHHGGRQRRSS